MDVAQRHQQALEGLHSTGSVPLFRMALTHERNPERDEFKPQEGEFGSEASLMQGTIVTGLFRLQSWHGNYPRRVL